VDQLPWVSHLRIYGNSLVSFLYIKEQSKAPNSMMLSGKADTKSESSIIIRFRIDTCLVAGCTSPNNVLDGGSILGLKNRVILILRVFRQGLLGFHGLWLQCYVCVSVMSGHLEVGTLLRFTKMHVQTIRRLEALETIWIKTCVCVLKERFLSSSRTTRGRGAL
jgi:hypothetical protein